MIEHQSNRYRFGWLFSAVLTAVIVWLLFGFQSLPISADGLDLGTEHGSAAASSSELENYDIRIDQSAQARSTLAEYREHVSGSGEDRSALGVAMHESQARLIRLVPGLKHEWNELLNSPEIVGTWPNSGAMLTPPSTASREKIVRDFLTEYHALYGLSRTEIAGLKKISDYSNPAGNISWIEFRQEIHGIPVFQGELRAALTWLGELGRTVGALAPGLNERTLATRPRLNAADAIVAGAAGISVEVAPSEIEIVFNDEHHATFKSPLFYSQSRVELLYFPTEQGVARLAWSMVLWRPAASYYVIVDAMTGRLLFRKCITFNQTQTATYSVYDNDSPAPLSPSTALPGSPVVVPGIPRSTLSFVSELPAADNLGWIPDGGNTTTGNNVDAGLDVEPPIGIDPNGRPIGNPFRVFSFSYSPQPTGNDPTSSPGFRFGSVTNLFFWANRFHDRLYEAGFTEPARNAQENNFGRGGLEHDPIIIDVHRIGISLLSVSSGPDGFSPRLVTGEIAAGDFGLDQETVIHEMAHMVSSRLHGNGSGLGSLQAGGMGEGWSDFYTRALLSSADESLDGYFAFAGYAATYLANLTPDGYYYGLRRFPYAIKSSLGVNGLPHNPLTFADMDPVQINTNDGAYPRSPWISNTANEVHNAGEIWCLALLEVRARLIRRLGFAEGNRRMLQLVTDGMKLDPLNPRFLQGRDAIFAADQIGFNGADLADIWRGFATRGMGIGASSTGTAVIESYSSPFRQRFDFDGDAKTDFAVFRPAEGQWYVLNSSNDTSRAQPWGIATDVLVPGDYDGDGKTDVAVFRPAEGNWYVLQSSNNTFRAQAWGTSGDVPVPEDYDGDNRDDFAVFRGGVWFILQSSTSNLRVQAWGSGPDQPVVGDYDGDARADFAVFRPGDGTWYLLFSSNNSFVARPFGQGGDLPVIGDYDGDGRDDLAVFRNGTWYITQSSNNAFRAQGWGLSTDRPTPGDYDGDGKADLAVFRPSIGTWFVLQSANASLSSRQWGQSGDFPVPSAYVP